MYTLQKAKEEIDAVAKHATDIAVHTLAIADNLDAKLESFKTELAHLIDAKIGEMVKMFTGDTDKFETSAVNDLGQKVSLLIKAAAPAAAQGVGTSPHAPMDEPPHPHPDDQTHHQGGEHHGQDGEHHGGDGQNQHHEAPHENHGDGHQHY